MRAARITSVPALALLVSLHSSLASAADFLGQGTSILRIEQRAVPGFSKQTVLPFTQFLGADVDRIADGNLSFHLYGWGRVDLADRSTNEKGNDGDFTYGYLNYRFPRGNAEVKAGRFFIYEGVAAEQIDGVGARTDLAKGFSVALFSGAPVKLDRGSNTKGDFIVGGRGSYRFGGLFEVGISGLHEAGGTFDTATGFKSDRQLAGGDVWFSPTRRFEMQGHTFYNLATNGISENSYQVILRPHKTLTVSALYNEANLVHFFTSSNLRSLFNPDLGGKVRSFGGAATWSALPPLELTADYRHIERSESADFEQNGNSDRFGAEARATLLEKKLRTGLSYHRVAGATGFNSYDEVRGFLMYDSGRYIASLDGIGQIYQARIFNTKDAFEVIGSAGVRLKPELALSGEFGYGQNPRLSEELRGLVRLTFNYAAESKGAKK